MKLNSYKNTCDSYTRLNKNLIYILLTKEYTIVLCVFASVAAGASLDVYAPSTPPIPILRQSADGPNPDGSYSYSYETANGIQAQEVGYINYAGTKTESREAQGSYTYTAPNGEIVQVTYVANENGFQPQGSHIPTIPPEILKGLQYIAAHPEENNIDAKETVNLYRARRSV
ncbi:Larval cuticle protein LCP-17 [Melipona quadrifasciata]|uniref:Larval cuticle protein LCP-17 n=1 Tax=Melipona quadrifasciata TaxID=166423 RepID=A0A0M8ZQ66_9HYME|nr:Larval cuticle protein LCP-17 [Melipona quadrifasciata]